MSKASDQRHVEDRQADYESRCIQICEHEVAHAASELDEAINWNECNERTGPVERVADMLHDMADRWLAMMKKGQK